MGLPPTDKRPITSAGDLVRVRQIVRDYAVAAGFTLVKQTKMVTAASELARNTLTYGGGGTMTLALVSDGVQSGLTLVFEDNGPGISNIELALKDGYTTGGGLGMGLSGTRRLVNVFDLKSKPGEGTRVTITMWK